MQSGNQSLDVSCGVAMGGTKPPHYVISLTLATMAVLLGLLIPTWIGFLRSELRDHSDFPNFYNLAFTLRTHGGAYLYPTVVDRDRICTHPAFEALLFLPLSFLPIWTAYEVWAVANIAIVGALYWALREELEPLKKISPVLGVGLILAFFPLSFAVMNGQDSLVLALIAAWSFRCLRKGEGWRAGLLIGLSAFRYQFLLPFLALMLLWKMYRLVAGAAAMAAVCALLSVALAGLQGTRNYVHLILDMGNRSLTGNHYGYSDRMVNLRGLLFAVHHPSLGVPLSAVVILFALYRGRNLDGCSKFLAAIVTVELAGFYLFLYDTSVMIVPLLVAFAYMAKRGRYADLVVPLALIAWPTVILFTVGSGYFWMFSLVNLIFTFWFFLRHSEIAISELPLQTHHAAGAGAGAAFKIVTTELM